MVMRTRLNDELIRTFPVFLPSISVPNFAFLATRIRKSSSGFG
jgi:hypothetical protein